MRDKLAIFGGKPVNPGESIKYSSPQITEDDITAVNKSLRSGWVAGRSKVVTEFEQAIAELTGFNYAIAVNSATSGLYLLFVCGGKLGKINVPALTFAATMNAPLLAGVDVKITDVDEHTFVMNDMGHCSLPVSYAGYPVEWTSIYRDDAQYLSLVGKQNCSSNTISCVISTHGIKNITTGEGGVVLTNDSLFAKEIRRMSDHGHGWGNYGHNFRMSSLQASLGLSQLKRTKEMQAKRKNVAFLYRSRLANYRDVKMQSAHEEHSCHLFPIILKQAKDGLSRNEVRFALKAEGVLTQVHYEPLHLIAKRHPEAARIRASGNYPVSESMWHHGMSLPIHNNLSLREAELVMDAFDKIMEYYLL